jgi:hypothetical protein
MAAPTHPIVTGWKWKLAAAVLVSALLTWGEWIKHHPPEIAIIAVLHFLFVLIAIVLVVQIGRWLKRRL